MYTEHEGRRGGLAQLWLLLFQYKLEVFHRPSVKNEASEALSSLPTTDQNEHQLEEGVQN